MHANNIMKHTYIYRTLYVKMLCVMRIPLSPVTRAVGNNRPPNSLLSAVTIVELLSPE